MISFSEEYLKDAYGRMQIDSHPWARHTRADLETIGELCGGLDGKNIMDAGCGQGRFIREILNISAPKHITAIDISPENIDIAKQKTSDDDRVTCMTDDLRIIRFSESFDLILCLYDVIGSFPDECDNRAVMKTLYDSCSVHGYAAVSVMNFELTLANVRPENYGNISDDPKILFDLPASGTMQKSGNIFDPEFYAIDSGTNLVYRKEQLRNDDSLPAEYVIRDKRYTMKEISDMATECGFEIECSRYVQAGHMDVPLCPTDERAKKILLILRKRY